jgi:hypothetical protein
MLLESPNLLISLEEMVEMQTAVSRWRSNQLSYEPTGAKTRCNDHQFYSTFIWFTIGANDIFALADSRNRAGAL